MEAVLKEIERGGEAGVRAALADFNDKNKTNFSLGEDAATRKRFCSSLLSALSVTSSWSLETKMLALTALRIFAREKLAADSLTCVAGLMPIVQLAELHCDHKESCFASGELVPSCKVQVLVEAVKCLCNILLNNKHLVPTCTDLGCLCGLALRLALCQSRELPHDVVFFDLRLLFLITACGVEERKRFRDNFNGIPILINVLDSVLFGLRMSAPRPSKDSEEVTETAAKSKVQSSNTEKDVSKQPSNGEAQRDALEDTSEPEGAANESMGIHQKGFSESVPSLSPLRDSVYCLRTVPGDEQFAVMSEVLKILFNQTVHWHEDSDYDDEEIVLYTHIAHLIRILLISVPVQLSRAAMQTLVHCIEVLVNVPGKCAHIMLLPPHIRVMPTLQQLHPSTYPPSPSPLRQQQLGTTKEEEREKEGGAEGGGAEERGENGLYITDLDRVFDDWNMAAIVAILNLLYLKLRAKTDYSSLPPILSALRLLSKGHRSIRRLLKSEILPPLQKARQRPDEGDSLKSRIVRLMTAGSHGAEEVTAEFLFVLCKESASRLIKHTGYGNAAGLLTSHGLLGGGRSEGEGDYSSNSEMSDAEDSNVDPVTGGPSQKGAGSPLDHMTEEEKEAEAEKLHGLLEKLDRQGIIKVLPLNQSQKPVVTKDESSDSDEELD